MTVNRELRVGATQSPEALNLAREQSGGTADDMPLRMSPLQDLHGVLRATMAWQASCGEELDAA
ncbi:hypothetical protein A3844_24515 [Paenibacillus helianthi]|uniref:Uncharacterized protein n=1 Tax=Paenibacillus helianthi TaxID=1349432 RepID=A0ABX3EH56_9BACL|nr:hypothetical protein A3842_20675 [Paenibacillus sp. P3E]OKP82022.1 hypothetical protein A3844_24515 [Paenibacillus helianthi]OKP94610.1 hypothetical protein A3848_01095 [Paenibacillus sp. P32E]